MLIIKFSKPTKSITTYTCAVSGAIFPPGCKHLIVDYIQDEENQWCRILDGLQEVFTKWGPLCSSAAEICEEIETALDGGDLTAVDDALKVLSFAPDHYLGTHPAVSGLLHDIVSDPDTTAEKLYRPKFEEWWGSQPAERLARRSAWHGWKAACLTMLARPGES